MRGPRGAELNVVKLTAELMARVDAWAQANTMSRSDAVQRLIAQGLKSETLRSETKAKRMSQQDAIAIEHRTAEQLDQMIDPETSPEERDRRIHRLTEGPPEFVELRIDLPGRRGKC
jgi:metal-responsive CopG/Arc/MetJ family transcriptional regulator